MEINYKSIRNATSHYWYERTMSEYLCMALSPYISILFIKKGVTPNTVTLLMIIFGVISPLLFMIDNIWIQFVASLLFIFWFVLDCSDGEVARFTRNFSKHGRDLDYMSHVSCHSLFIIAMWKLYAFNSIYCFELTVFFFILIAAELFYRMSVLYSTYVDEASTILNTKHSLLQVVNMNLTYFPNYVVFMPFVYCLSYWIGFNAMCFFIVIFSIYIAVKIKLYILMILKFYKS